MTVMEPQFHQELKNIHCPKDLKELPKEKLPQLAEEIREELVRIVSETGGHLASNLGVVELTLALHRVFDCPKDHIIFDVGHQSYVHKMLTGRYEKMESLRQAGGLSGFPNREESKYDCFGTGHSSTSLSAALGFAMSDRLHGSDAYTIAVVGDGAYTGGMIHEALNNCQKELKLIIIMNENEMSISKNIGRLATCLSRLRTRPGYFKTKKATGAFLKKLPWLGRKLFYVVRGVKKSVKNALYGSNYFESMGLTYLGPIDGNDYEAVEGLLQEAKKLDESVVLHVKTKKGKGYIPAEQAPDLYHGMSPKAECATTGMTFSEHMGEQITRLAETDERITAITAAMCDGTGLCAFKKHFPERFHDVGIAEEHAVTFSAGLAANGMRPVVAIYSTFLQRGYDNIIHDVALQGLPCILCIDRAGLNAGDGATHHGIFDVSFLSQIPKINLYTPITLETLSRALREAYECAEPCAIRYPSGRESSSVVDVFYPNGSVAPLGAVCNYKEKSAPPYVIVTHGRIVKEALEAVRQLKEDGLSVGIILLEKIKPYGECAKHVATLLPKSVRGVIFLEEEIRSGGMGMNLVDQLTRFYTLGRHAIFAVEDSFVEHRSAGQSIYDAAGISAAHICRQIRQWET